MDKISVIIPMYNAEQYIGDCLKSIISQNYPEVEVIVVDDCSKDDSLRICKKISDKDKRIKVIEQLHNKGPMNARKIGVQNASGKYIIFCDSDDLFPENAFNVLVKSVESGKYDLVIGTFAMLYGNKYKTNMNRLEPGEYKCKQLLKKQIDDGTFSGILISSMCGKIYKAETIKRFIKDVPIDVRINEDGLFNTYFLLNADSVYVINDVTYVARRWKKMRQTWNGRDDFYVPADTGLMQLKSVWPDEKDFNLQMERRCITEKFWLCNKASGTLPFWKAYLYVKTKMREINATKDWDKILMNYQSMRKYKVYFAKLMRFNMPFIFVISSRWVAPVLRKYIAR